MPNPPSTSLIPWLGAPSVGALSPLFTSDLDQQFQWHWPQVHEAANDETSGVANFLTTVEVTGELSPQASQVTLCRLVSLAVLGRLTEKSLMEACHSLV